MRDSDLHQDVRYLTEDEAQRFGLRDIPKSENVIHHYHHYESHEPTLTIRGERNTKGWNVEIGVSGARSVEEAVKLLDELKTQAEARFGGGVV